MVDIVYEDNHLLVCIKPQNLPVQKDDSNDEDLQRMLKKYLVEKYNKKGDAYLGIVHRLDRVTGGLIVFAKTSKCAERLTNQIKSGEMKKTYLAVVDGKPRLKSMHLTNYLKKYENENIVRIVPQYEEGAKEAQLDYVVLDTKENKSLLLVSLITGRSHQIRVQLSNIGCPIVNDQKYNKNAEKGNIALYATKLSLLHPITKKTYTFKTLPDHSLYPWNLFNLDKYNF